MKAPRLLPVLNLLRRYHRHSVEGMENIPRKGAALIVTNHSFATYDSFMLGAAILERRKRLTRALGDRLLFKIPGLADLMKEAGVVPAAPDAAVKLLRSGYLLGVTPGGMREALRPAKRKYTVDWADRKGFARVAFEAQCPIILAACPASDDIFDVDTGPVTQLLYERLHLPFAIPRGLKGLPIPRPVKLTHFLSKPYLPPKMPRGKAAREKAVDAWHAELTAEMERLLRARA